MDLLAKRELNKGFGDTLARGFELAFTPAVFGAIGFGLDHLFGILPVLTLTFTVFAIVGMFVKLWYGYDLEMKSHEAKLPKARTSEPTS
jgi:hypothetical protein